MSTTIWAASAVTPAGTDRIPVDVSGAGGPSRWTGQQVADVNTLIGGTVTALGSIGTNTAINLALGGYFSATITGNLTFSITNVPASAGVTFVLALTNGGAFTVTLPGSVTIIGGSPVLSAAGTDWLVFRTLDGGTAWTLEVVGNPRDADLATWATITPAANVGAFLATPSSANLASAVTDETGSGSLVFGTAPTLSGAVQLAEEASIQPDATLSADGKWSGIHAEAGVLGETVSFGQVCYFKAADSRWWLADASSVTTSGDVRVGVCVVAGNAASSTTILFTGNIRADALFPTFTISGPLHISETAGAMTQTAPTTTDSVTRRIGFARTADAADISVSNDYYTHV